VFHREPPRSSAIGRIEREVAGDLAFPAVAVFEQALLVEIELLARFDGEFGIRPSTMASTGQDSWQRPQ